MSPNEAELKSAKRPFGRLGIDVPHNDPLKMRAAAEAAGRKAREEALNTAGVRNVG